MTRVISAASTPREMIVQAIAATSAIVSLLPDGVNAIVPRPGVDIQAIRRPFLLVRFEGKGSQGPGDMDLGVWVFEIHDRVGRAPDTMLAVAGEIEWLFDLARWERPTTGRAWPRRSFRAGSVGPLTDATYGTQKVLQRIQVVSS